METSDQLDEEPTIVVREPGAATQVAPQDNQLVSERGIPASSRIFDLKSEARTARMKHGSRIIPPA